MSDSPTDGLSPLFDMRCKLTAAEKRIAELETAFVKQRSDYEQRTLELESAIDVVRTYIQARDAKLRPLDSFPELAPGEYIEMVQAIAALEEQDDET